MASGRRGTGRQRANSERVDIQRVDGMVFRAIDVVVRGAVDDDVRPQPLQRHPDRAIIGDVEIPANQGNDLVPGREFVNDGGPELASSAGDRDPHHAALYVRSVANAFIRASSKTPSQRATTTAAMQLPITFTAVRPMSMI